MVLDNGGCLLGLGIPVKGKNYERCHCNIDTVNGIEGTYRNASGKTDPLDAHARGQSGAGDTMTYLNEVSV